MFGKISQDYNPIHFDENYAKTTKFQRCICHGHLVTSLFSGLLGSQFDFIFIFFFNFPLFYFLISFFFFFSLPGKGSIYLNQTFEYVAPGIFS